MTNRELIKCLLDVPLDKEVLLSYAKKHIDDMGEECKGYVFHIDNVENNGFGVCINFTDWRDREAHFEDMRKGGKE